MSTVDILVIEGCSAFDETRRMVEETLAEDGRSLPMRVTVVRDCDEAVALQFLGSPTVRVRNRDIEVFRHNDERFGYGCRIYRAADGSWTRVPPKEYFVLALERYGR